MTEHDNTNKGAGWPAKAVSGSANVGGGEFYVSIVGTGVAKPSHNIFLVSKGPDSLTYSSALFRCDNPEHGLASGQIAVGGFGYWVNMYKNKSDNDRSPLVDLRFKPKDPPVGEEAPYQPEGDDIPF